MHCSTPNDDFTVAPLHLRYSYDEPSATGK